MSASYSWEPVNPPLDQGISLGMADALARRQGWQRRDLNDHQLDRDDLEWLRGVSDSGASCGEDAAALIKAIEAHGAIVIRVTY